MSHPRLRIDSTPRGEAPLWVREKWVGLELPLAQKKMEPLRLRVGFGVLTGPKTWIGEILAWLTGRLRTESGFLVSALAAVDVLERASPMAAAWWRENASFLMRPRRMLLFQSDCCHVVSGEEPNNSFNVDVPKGTRR
jgi:hypothetical protein